MNLRYTCIEIMINELFLLLKLLINLVVVKDIMALQYYDIEGITILKRESPIIKWKRLDVFVRS